ncbi:hypothetical protein [Asaia krungthepensis]|uniref:Uncharacterized protein n=1 Tax=Asaia krungthepensis NRIC 0535 TaxID=1307925 RepID=A0ABQ0PW07_9PROT|nr:hypothetical protein [Asaia krungthepensis]GBQ83036.1 hypothetical protein AA0535_0144 [Asaia krungthepensis NRIC 0535]
MTDRTETADQTSTPEERIEEALDRIAYALHHRRSPTPQATDWRPVAANIEALHLRVRDLIERLGDEGEV